MKSEAGPFIGKWLITEMEEWDQEYVNMEVTGHFTFRENGMGHFQFGLVRGDMDFRPEAADGRERIAFSWEETDETDPASGRGWAEIDGEKLAGRIFFHEGDESAFHTERA